MSASAVAGFDPQPWPSEPKPATPRRLSGWPGWPGPAGQDEGQRVWGIRPAPIDYTTWTGLKEHYVQSRRHFYCQHCDEHFDDGGELAEHMDDAHFYCSSFERAPLLHPLPPAVHLRKQPQRAYELGAAQATHDHVPRPRLRAVLHQRPVASPRISRRAAARRARTGSRSTATSAQDTRNVITRPPRLIAAAESDNTLRRDRAQLERHRVRVLPLPRQVPHAARA
ncbi:hypothetical protein MIND_00181000 [Mycena indigotica]|uniref:C2H2-type domain-containing protein n=1 Tax=Mycena indigotica TaxID=2126181 RepID=A0A8H6T7N4_9AGAR|nr:uncharacterized protein MIND_00181000 [Mycena indigotica]KAF7311711.1 hypothetical protein MIND_00181000 [Mycena indigotica]